MRKSRTARIYYGEKPMTLYWTVKVRDATRSSRINGTLAEALVGEPGRTLGCHLSVTAQDHPEAFPHPVLLVSITRSRALVVEKITKGKPSHAVKYAHNY